jgi:hypothetical protein
MGMYCRSGQRRGRISRSHDRRSDGAETRGRLKTPEDKTEVMALLRKALEFYRSAERSTGTR